MPYLCHETLGKKRSAPDRVAKFGQHSWTQCLNIGHLYRCSTLKSGDDVVLEIDCFEKSSRTHICEPKTSVGT